MRDDGLPSGTLTFLFTDIEGSTALLRRLGDDYSEVLAVHHELIRDAVRLHRGHEVQTDGDAFFIVFEDAENAVSAALAAQRSLVSHPWAHGELRVRMGLHTGAATMTTTGYVGMAIHAAARLAATARGGQVVVSDTTRALVRNRPIGGASFLDLGLHHLKDFDEPQRLYQLVHRDLPAEHAPLRTRGAHNLPAPPGPLIGRDDDLAAVVALMRSQDARLITVSGPGGVGKTRVALAAAEEVAREFRDGVRLVPLAAVGDAASVGSAISAGVGLPDLQGPPRDVVDRLRDHELLLILDNFEHLLDASDLVARLLAGCPEITVVVTSRAVLGLQSERCHVLAGLAIPPVHASADTAALRLFEARAQEVQPSFSLGPDNRDAISAICRRLDGIPLAIELAAPRLKLFSPDGLLERLDDRFGILKGGGRDRAARHQTLEAAIGWSYDLLDEEERALLRDLSVCSGGFDVDAAEAVSGSTAALEALSGLLDKSLISPDTSATGGPRWIMLESVRAFAAERLAEAGSVAAAERHAWCFSARALAEVETLASAGRAGALARLATESDNLRTALEWLVEAGRTAEVLELAAALGWYWYHRGELQDGRRRLDAALALPGSVQSGARGRALTAAARLAYYAADFEAARSNADAAVAIARALADRRDLGYALYVRALASQGLGDAGAIAFAREAVEHMRAVEDEWGLALALFYLGIATLFLGDRDEAVRALLESETIFRSLGDEWGIGGTIFYRAALTGDDRPEEAEQQTAESVEMFRRSGDRWRLMVALGALAELRERLGHDVGPLRAEAAVLGRQLGR